MSGLREMIEKVQAQADRIDADMDAAKAALAKARHDQRSLRSAILACLDECDRIDPLPTSPAERKKR